MRIISGIYKGRRFDIPHTFKARPTTDFAKENLFNVLSNKIDFTDGVTALDLFSGTGSIALELLSRGCDRVISVEKDRLHYSFIQKAVQQLKAEGILLLNTDAFKYIQHCHTAFDFIFADPPYALENIREIPDMILSNQLLKQNGLLVLEHGKTDDFTQHPCFTEHRSYGSVNFSFFRHPDFLKEETITPDDPSHLED